MTTLPGTTIEANLERPDISNLIFTNIFMTGGLMLSQVSQLTGLEPYIVQNWVKRGFLSSPKNKMYTRRQFCRIVIINMLKDSMRLDKITSLLSYINGVLSDESDDLIDDSDLYDYYIAMLYRTGNGIYDPEKLDEAIGQTVAGYKEPYPGAKTRLSKVLRIMAVAHCASYMAKKAELMLGELG